MRLTIEGYGAESTHRFMVAEVWNNTPTSSWGKESSAQGGSLRSVAHATDVKLQYFFYKNRARNKRIRLCWPRWSSSKKFNSMLESRYVAFTLWLLCCAWDTKSQCDALTPHTDKRYHGEQLHLSSLTLPNMAIPGVSRFRVWIWRSSACAVCRHRDPQHTWGIRQCSLLKGARHNNVVIHFIGFANHMPCPGGHRRTLLMTNQCLAGSRSPQYRVPLGHPLSP